MAARRADILSRYDPKQAAFLDFVLAQYIEEGEDELQPGKLPGLLELKYGTPADALKQLGRAEDVRLSFRGFQKGLYEQD